MSNLSSERQNQVKIVNFPCFTSHFTVQIMSFDYVFATKHALGVLKHFETDLETFGHVFLIQIMMNFSDIEKVT